MNFFDVELADDALVSEDFRVTIPDSIRGELAGSASEFVFGILPEEILSQEEAAASDDAFGIDVNVVEPLGDVTYLYTDISGSESTISVDRNTDIESGDWVQIAFPQSEVHVFDSRTGEALITRGEPVGEDLTGGDAETSSETSQA